MDSRYAPYNPPLNYTLHHIINIYPICADRSGQRKRESLMDNVEPTSTRQQQRPSPSPNRNNNSAAREPENNRNINNDSQEPYAQDGENPWEEEGESPTRNNIDNQTRSGGNGGASTGQWEASEWGPAPPRSPEDIEDDEFGWSAESWRGRGGPSTSGRNIEDDGSRFENPSGRRQRRKQRGEYDYVDEADEAAQTNGRRSTSKTAAAAAEDDEDAFFPEEDGEDLIDPDIVLLSPDEIEPVLPVVPFSAQASYFNGGATQAVQRWGASLALTVLLSKVALLAATSLTWPLWWPWAQAATKNYGLRKSLPYAGLWRTKVLDVEIRGRPKLNWGQKGAGLGSRFSALRTTRFVLGDEGGAQTELVLPHDSRHDLITVGQPVELIVLSADPSFGSFKAVKDAFLPESGLWLSEYPFINRPEFLEVSLEIEREAQAAAAGEWTPPRGERRDDQFGQGPYYGR